jgi:hypothetical protein
LETRFLRIVFETIAGVVPLVISVWDDDGAFHSCKHQTTKENISEILKGFQEMTARI